MTDAFEEAQRTLASFLAELAAFGIRLEDDFRLHKGDGLMCYYDFETRRIYLSLPDPNDPAGKLKMLFMRSLVGCESNEELLEFTSLFIPRLVAHELGHCLRDKFGRFGRNLWEEEHIANQLGAALSRSRLSPSQRERLLFFLKRATRTIEPQIKERNEGVGSYFSVAHALNARGELKSSALTQLQFISRVFALRPEEMIRDSGAFSPGAVSEIERRPDIIRVFNEVYTSDLLRCTYYHMSWAALDLETRESHYVEEFLRDALGRGPELLLPIRLEGPVRDQEIEVCYAAYDQLEKSSVAARYFYRRYRTLLLQRLEEALVPDALDAGRVLKEVRSSIETWDESGVDFLDLLNRLAPPELRSLFPGRIRSTVSGRAVIADNFRAEADRRLWQAAGEGAADSAALATQERLALLDGCEIFRSLPAEVALELARLLLRIRVAVGERVVWKGDRNEDVYFVSKGRLQVLDDWERGVASIGSGEIFGEMAFFTHEPRTATVRAVEDSECYVIKSTDLYVLALRYPVIFMQMAGVVAKRLARAQRRAQE